MKKWEWIDLTKVSLIVLFWITLFFTATFLIDTTVEEDVNNLDERISVVEETYYTQEEVDDMFNHLYDVVLPALENALIDNYLLIEQYEDDIDEILDYYDIKIAELQLQIDELGEQFDLLKYSVV